MSKRTFQTLCAVVFMGLFLGFSAQALAGKEHPVSAADKEHPVQQQHLKPTDEEMKTIRVCAEAGGVKDIASKELTKEQQETVDRCYRASSVVPPRDLEQYGTMKGQYY